MTNQEVKLTKGKLHCWLVRCNPVSLLQLLFGHLKFFFRLVQVGSDQQRF